MGKIIVTIPAYNGEAFIVRAIRSIQGQSYKDFDLYVMDNCSENDTATIVQELSKQDSRIHLRRNEANLGLMGNFNRCLRFALEQDADFFLLMCCDDVIYPNYLEKKAAILEAEPSVVMVCNATDIVDDKGKKLMTRRTLRGGFIEGRRVVRRSLYLGNIFGEPSGVLFRVEAMRRTGPFDERLFYSLDWEYASRIAMMGNVACIDEPLSTFCVSGGSASSRILKDAKRVKEEHDLVIEALCAHLGIRATPLRKFLSKFLYAGKNLAKALIFRRVGW